MEMLFLIKQVPRNFRETPNIKIVTTDGAIIFKYQYQYQYILLFFSQYNKIFKNSRIPQLVTFQTNLKSLGYPWVPTIKFK